MNNTRSRWSTSLFLLATFGIIAAAGTHSAKSARTGTDVVVTNTTSQAVPVSVQGVASVHAYQAGAYNVQLTGTPYVHAYQAGPYNVQLVGTPNVNVQNMGSTGNAFMIAMQSNISDGNQQGTTLSYQVPAGKRFIVTNVAATSNSVNQNSFATYVSIGAEDAIVDVPMSPTWGSSQHSQGNLQTYLVIDGGYGIYVSAARSGTAGYLSTYITLSGQLVNYP